MLWNILKSWVWGWRFMTQTKLWLQSQNGKNYWIFCWIQLWSLTWPKVFSILAQKTWFEDSCPLEIGLTSITSTSATRMHRTCNAHQPPLSSGPSRREDGERFCDSGHFPATLRAPRVSASRHSLGTARMWGSTRMLLTSSCATYRGPFWTEECTGHKELVPNETVMCLFWYKIAWINPNLLFQNFWTARFPSTLQPSTGLSWSSRAT